MKPYYILKTIYFNTELDELRSNNQLGISKVMDDKPTVKITKHKRQYISDYIKYNLYSECKVNIKGRAYGNNEIFNYMIQIFENQLYYNFKNDLLYLCCPKEVFNNFCKLLKNNEDIKFNMINVDFQKIIDNQKDLNIQAIWLDNVQNDITVNAISLIGNRLENSSKYIELLNEGCNITNISIVYKYLDKQKKIMITRDGGVVFYDNVPEAEAIEVTNDIYHNLFL